MSFQMKEGSGALFQNKDKKTDSHPNMTGEILINGKIMRIAAWTKLTKNGDKFLSLRVSENQDKQPTQARVEDIDNDIPF